MRTLEDFDSLEEGYEALYSGSIKSMGLTPEKAARIYRILNKKDDRSNE